MCVLRVVCIVWCGVWCVVCIVCVICVWLAVPLVVWPKLALLVLLVLLQVSRRVGGVCCAWWGVCHACGVCFCELRVGRVRVRVACGATLFISCWGVVQCGCMSVRRVMWWCMHGVLRARGVPALCGACGDA